MALTFHKLVEEPVAQAPPHLEPIVPNSGNRLRTKPFTLLWVNTDPIDAHGFIPVRPVKACRQRAESHAILFSFVSVIAQVSVGPMTFPL